MKQWIKEHVFLYKYYSQLKEFLMGRLSLINPTAVSKIRYKNNFGRALDLDNPKEFNEKLQWLKLNKYQNTFLLLLQPSPLPKLESKWFMWDKSQ